MGYMCHHAIVVTSWNEELIEEAHSRAFESGAAVSNIVPGSANEYYSFLVAPDGSKEGWDESDAGDRRRDELIAWLDEQRYEDGSTSLAWVEVQFGDGELHTEIVRDSDSRLRGAFQERN
ncbi:hypothetical protein PP713_14220 [Mycobacterium sp. CSUR Q5927]|nr:hypothetical protein [Mycobacterium sp. CSUR Q5927]